jgi:hypothetical protein
LFSLLGLASALVWANGARAQTVAYHIEFEAKPGCSSREAFVHELTSRTDKARAAVPEEEGPTITVKLLDNDGAIAGQLVLLEQNGNETRRGVAGQSCDETVAALALIAAVLVDPELVHGKDPPPARSVDPARPKQARPSGMRFAAAGGATLESAVSPNLSFGVFLELSAEYELVATRSVAFGIGAHRAWSETLSTDDGDADFTWTAARGWFCPVSLPNQGIFAFAPCVAVEAGQLHAEGSNTLDEQEHNVFWLAAAPMIRLELRPVRALSIFADGLFVIPLTEESTFRFDPATPVFTTPAVGWAAQAGVRVFFN